MKKFLSLLLSTFVFVMSLSAQKTVTGTVVDESGVPLIGVNIVVKGTTSGTITDIDGTYSIDVPDGSDILEFSFTGFGTEQVDVTTGSQFDITMGENSELLEEAVVVGYRDQTKPKSNVATQVIGAKTIENRPNVSLVQTLQGQVSGLNITTNSGQPGANSEIILRGYKSINGNNEPLFIIDGTPVDEDNFRSLNPNEIESISVLKDAGATAIYGNRGANGVIVIKTKRGKFNSGLKVGYSLLVGQASRQPISFDLMDAQESLRLERAYGSGRGAEIDEDSIARVVGTDWLDFFFRDPVTQTHNLNISTGGENFRTFTNFGYTDQQGILKDSGIKRYNFRSNLDGRSENGKFRYATKLSLNYSTNDEPNSIGSGAINRNYLLGAFQSVPYISIDEYVNGEALLSPLTFANTPLFLYDRLQTYTRYEKEIKAIGSLDLSYDILKTDNSLLTANSNIGVDFVDQNLVRGEGPTSFNALLFAQTGNVTPGFQQQRNDRVFSYNWLNSLIYSTTLSDVHNITAGLYTEYFRATLDNFSFFQEGLDPRTYFPGDGSGFIEDNALNDFFVPDVGADKLYAGLFSYFASLDYDYNSRYGIGATIRRDASYRFSSSNRWGTFYSISARWNLDQEPFMESLPFDLLKLRASYGSTGNQRITVPGNIFYNYFASPDLTENFFGTGSGYGGQNSLFLSQIGNTTLKWETINQINVGLDFELMNSRLRGAVDVYSIKTVDLFQDRPVSAINAITSQRANIGSLSNKGIDFNIRYDIYRRKGLIVEAYVNSNYNKSEIIDLPTPDGRIQGDITVRREGGPITEYWVYRYVGVNPANGELLFLDADGNVTENPSPDTDRVDTGLNRIPDWSGSFGLNFDYKGVYLETQFNYVTGVYRFAFDYSSVIDPTSIGQFRMSNDLLRAWEEDGQITDIPSLNATNLALDDDSDRFLFKSDYLRLRFIKLGYTIPNKILQDLNFDRLQFYVMGENIKTWTPWRGYNPEGTGNASRNYPSPRIISFGLDLAF